MDHSRSNAAKKIRTVSDRSPSESSAAPHLRVLKSVENTVHAWRTPNRVWITLFGAWGVLLSGSTWGFTGSPGFLQQYRLSSLYEMKQSDLALIDAENEDLNLESEKLERSPVAQEREVRRTLGYVGADEMIFDFTASPFSYQNAEAVVSARTDDARKAKL